MLDCPENNGIYVGSLDAGAPVRLVINGLEALGENEGALVSPRFGTRPGLFEVASALGAGPSARVRER